MAGVSGGRVLLAAAGLLLLAQLAGAYLLGRHMLSLDLARDRAAAEAKTEQLAAATAPALRFGRAAMLGLAADSLGRRMPEVLAIRFERSDGEVVHEWARGPVPEREGVLRIEAPVRGAEGGSLGRVVLVWDQEELILQATRHYQGTGLLAMSGAFALAALAYALLRRRERRFRAVEEASLALARRDPLTGLLNRRGLADAMGDAALAGAGQPVALLLGDLDRFKPVNDAYGHEAGDQLLRELAWRLGQAVGPGGVAARLGGDEFAALVPLAADDPEGAAETVAARLLRVVERPFAIRPGSEDEDVPGFEVQVGLSLGVALAPRDATEPSELMRRADAALYRAKARGRGQWCRFAPEMDPRCGTRRGSVRLEAELREALGQGALICHYQPIRALRGGALAGFEALARWPHPGRGFIPPSEFIPIAEGSGLIAPLTEGLLRVACRDAAGWGEGVLSFNLSPLQLRDQGLPRMVGAALAEAGLPPSRLQLELTEGALVGDMRLGRGILEELRGIGVRLALDDFGTGYSGLQELQALPFDTLKIDASFVRAMAVDGGARKIVAAVIGLGESLGLRVVAEGVEEEPDAEALRRLGCGYGQGWLYGRPMPQHQALELARARLPA